MTSGTIVAPATAPGGALSVIRISGNDAIEIAGKFFRSPHGKELSSIPGYSSLFGHFHDHEGTFIDEVIVTVYRCPHSYTGENMVEISCHGSAYITRMIIRSLIDGGARSATPGEFTLRSFLGGRIDLTQAEAVAEMIASESRNSHKIAVGHMRGGYSTEFKSLRASLLDFLSLLELELDFSEEDVQFADRTKLIGLIDSMTDKIRTLTGSYHSGNVVMNGVNTAIIGPPNSGKSTLLNRLLNEQRAIVSDIPGTTRDTVDDTLDINGYLFRFTDTAGIRTSTDIIENIGMERSFAAAQRSDIILAVMDLTDPDGLDSIDRLLEGVDPTEKMAVLFLLNKTDKLSSGEIAGYKDEVQKRLARYELPYGDIVPISAKTDKNIDVLKERLTEIVGSNLTSGSDVTVTNMRHFDSLNLCCESLARARTGLLDNIPTDLVASEVREASHHISTVTGDITTSDILQNIFSKFCIGK